MPQKVDYTTGKSSKRCNATSTFGSLAISTALSIAPVPGTKTSQLQPIVVQKNNDCSIGSVVLLACEGSQAKPSQRKEREHETVKRNIVGTARLLLHVTWPHHIVSSVTHWSYKFGDEPPPRHSTHDRQVTQIKHQLKAHQPRSTRSSPSSRQATEPASTPPQSPWSTPQRGSIQCTHGRRSRQSSTPL